MRCRACLWVRVHTHCFILGLCLSHPPLLVGVLQVGGLSRDHTPYLPTTCCWAQCGLSQPSAVHMLPLRSLNGNTSFMWDLQRKRYSLNGCALLEGGKIHGTWSQWDVLTIPGEKDLSISSAFPDQGCPGQAQMPSVRAEWWPQSCPSSSALSPPQMPVSAQWLCDSVGAMSSPWGPGLPSWTGTPKQSPPSSSSSRINPTTGSMMGKWIQRGGFLLVSSCRNFPWSKGKLIIVYFI